MKKLAIAFALISVFFFGLVGAIEYPKPHGYVNDFANLLPLDVAKKLETELRTYKEQTSIEVAVVTVNSLEGLSVEDYTIELARHWGVGEKKKDNGVVFLIAPNERKARIEVGYGLESDLTDAQAGRIMRDQILPLFKEGRMPDGVVAGVVGILQQLGDMPYRAREEERAALVARDRLEAERRKKIFANFLMVAAPIVVAGFLLVLIAYRVQKYRARKRTLMVLHEQNQKLFQESIEKISEAEQEHKLSMTLLIELKKENPKEAWEELEKKVSAVPEIIKALREKEIKTVNIFVKGGWEKAEDTSGVIAKFHSDALGCASVYEMLKVKEAEIKTARAKSTELLKSFPNVAESAKKILNHQDVTELAREKLKDADRKYTAAKAMLTLAAPMLNWLVVYAFLSSALALAKNALSMAESDKAEAERARREGPKLLKEIPAEIKKADEAVSDSDVSSATKQKVGEAKVKYAQAKTLVKEGLVDWLVAFGLLVAAAALVKDAVSKAKSEKDDAERRRRHQRDDDSYRSSSSSPSWSSGGLSSGSSDGGFGGFGGGGFGGGGASGSW